MMIETCQNGYELHVPTSGGKAGKGLNRTSALQVRLGNQIVHQVRFRTASPEARAEAVQKARDWVMAQSLKPAAPPPAGQAGTSLCVLVVYTADGSAPVDRLTRPPGQMVVEVDMSRVDAVDTAKDAAGALPATDSLEVYARLAAYRRVWRLRCGVAAACLVAHGICRCVVDSASPVGDPVFSRAVFPHLPWRRTLAEPVSTPPPFGYALPGYMPEQGRLQVVLRRPVGAAFGHPLIADAAGGGCVRLIEGSTGRRRAAPISVIGWNLAEPAPCVSWPPSRSTAQAISGLVRGLAGPHWETV